MGCSRHLYSLCVFDAYKANTLKQSLPQVRQVLLLLFPTAARPTCAGAGHRQGGPEPAVRAVDGHGGRPVPRPPQRRVPGEQVPVLRPRGAHHPLPHQASRGEQRIALCFNLRQAAATKMNMKPCVDITQPSH